MNTNPFEYSHNDFYNRLKLFIDSVKKSFPDVESVPGLSKQTVSTYKNRKSLPSGLILAQWAHEFGLNIHWLLTGEGNMYAIDPESPGGSDEAKLIENSIATLQTLLIRYRKARATDPSD